MPTDSATDFDVIVIGAGPPGENAADYAHQGGLSVALVESELVGGECSYWACMPSKALLRPVETLALAKVMEGVPVASDATLDAAAVLARRDAFTHNHDDSSQVDWATGAGLTVIRGHGRLAGERTVTVTDEAGTRTLRAKHAVVLATGTRAAVPPIPGLRDINPWTSREVTNLHHVPSRVIVFGAGVVGCEASTWLNGLGAHVTLVAREDRLLVRNEAFAGDLVAESMRNAGIELRLSATVTEVSRTFGGEVTAVVDGVRLIADEIVVATGRTPNSSDVGLDTVGLAAEGYVDTDDTLLVAGVDGEWLYAVGDINGRALLTHMGKYQARVCGDVIAARAHHQPLAGRRFAATSDHGQVPQVTFTDPQVASVGVTEEEARKAGHHVRCVELDIQVAGSSLLRSDYKGHAKLVVDTASETILGATFVGPEVGEIIHAATVAVVGNVTLDELWHAVPSYPTASEVWLRLLEAWRT